MLGPERSAQTQVPMDVGRNPLDLTPLRLLGHDALDTSGFPALIKVILRELEICWGNIFHQVTIRRAHDLFDCLDDHGAPWNPIPQKGVLIRAVFHVQFSDSPKPRPVEILTPHLLKIVRVSDADLLEPWLLKRGFRTAQKLSRFSILMLLALLSAFPPAFDDDDADDDDDDHRNLPVSRLSVHRFKSPVHLTNAHSLAVP